MADWLRGDAMAAFAVQLKFPCTISDEPRFQASVCLVFCSRRRAGKNWVGGVRCSCCCTQYNPALVCWRPYHKEKGYAHMPNPYAMDAAPATTEIYWLIGTPLN